jgi:hypothetical protein
MLAFSSAACPWSPHILYFIVNKPQVAFSVLVWYLIEYEEKGAEITSISTYEILWWQRLDGRTWVFELDKMVLAFRNTFVYALINPEKILQYKTSKFRLPTG